MLANFKLHLDISAATILDNCTAVSGLVHGEGGSSFAILKKIAATVSRKVEFLSW